MAMPLGTPPSADSPRTGSPAVHALTPALRLDTSNLALPSSDLSPCRLPTESRTRPSSSDPPAHPSFTQALGHQAAQHPGAHTFPGPPFRLPIRLLNPPPAPLPRQRPLTAANQRCTHLAHGRSAWGPQVRLTSPWHRPIQPAATGTPCRAGSGGARTCGHGHPQPRGGAPSRRQAPHWGRLHEQSPHSSGPPRPCSCVRALPGRGLATPPSPGRGLSAAAGGRSQPAGRAWPGSVTGFAVRRERGKSSFGKRLVNVNPRHRVDLGLNRTAAPAAPKAL